MNWTISRVAVLVSLTTNLVVVGITFLRHRGIQHEFASVKGGEILGAVALSIALIFVACIPWFLTMSVKRADERKHHLVFSTLATLSALWFFIPSPLTPEEALGFYVLGHLAVVWLAYGFSLFFRPRDRGKHASNNSLKSDAAKPRPLG